MKYDIVLCGVGGQGVLSLAAAIAGAAMKEGLAVRQSEVHGMAQRGGAVSAHLRVSDAAIRGDLIPRGGADMILSMEPMESLRYIEWLSSDGILITATEPFVNIPDYPEPQGIRDAIGRLPRSELVAALDLAKAAGNARAVNTVLVGAASRYLPLRPKSLEAAIAEAFAAKGEAMVSVNVMAFRAGRGPAAA